MERISRDEVLKVARLARLELADDDVARFQEQLSDILAAVSKISELDLAGVPPTAHPLEIQNAWDADIAHDCLSVEEAFANAPEREGDLFKVPPA